jgi:hypothetical protein
MITLSAHAAWLDTKRQPYQLDQPRSCAELAKDGAALASTSFVT